jgi:hypothetical protein
LVCPGSARNDLPDRSTPEAEAGTIAHEYAQRWIAGDFSGYSYDGLIDRILPLLGQSKADAIADATAFYVQTVNEELDKPTPERKVKSARIEDFGGTIDCHYHRDGAIRILDFKSGTYDVPAHGNTQLMSYMLLARELYPEATDFLATIVQPRVDERVRHTSFTSQELDLFEAEVWLASRSTSIVANPGCRWCPLLPTCKVGQAAGYRQHPSCQADCSMVSL